jgi:hypothetical protein
VCVCVCVCVCVLTHNFNTYSYPQPLTPNPMLSHRYSALDEFATVTRAMDAVIKPVSASATCPRDGERGCAYVDTLSDADDVGRAIALLSYAYDYKVSSVVNALESWTRQKNKDPKKTYIWICA